jgi:hypothetical protein
MPFLPLRTIPDCPTRIAATSWLEGLSAALASEYAGIEELLVAELEQGNI